MVPPSLRCAAAILLFAGCKPDPDPIDSAPDSPSPSACFADLDGDGFGAGEVIWLDFCVPGTTTLSGDCDPDRAEVSPNGVEVCDRLDNDCDGLLDDGAIDAPPWYPDGDGDGFGAGVAVMVCEVPPGFSINALDCDDGDVQRFPAAPERCDGVDDDCDQAVDEDPIDGLTVWPDGDGDGFGAEGPGAEACEVLAGEADQAGDCDDTTTRVHPGAAESDCEDPRDYNCDGSVGRVDRDGDGFLACEECYDASPEIHPGARETCNEIDDDCDGVIDPNSALDADLWYQDGDGDGWGDDALRACWPPAGYVADSGDCLDADPLVSPDATELCSDGLDNDCDGTGNGCGAYGLLDLNAQADLTLVGEYPWDYAGSALASADFTGDGLPDLLIGAYNSSLGAIEGGAVYMVDPQAASPGLATASAVFTGEGTADYVGLTLSAVDDANGDGVADALIGARGNSGGGIGAGAAYLLFGPFSGAASLANVGMKFTGELSSRAGSGVADAGDLNADGLSDLLIGADGYSTAHRLSEGGVYLLLSPHQSPLSPDGAAALIVGEGTSDYFGRDVAGVGDLDGDGRDDIVASAPSVDTDIENAGRVYIFCDAVAGEISASDATARITGDEHRRLTALSMQGMGDSDGDGYAELVLGVAADSTFLEAAGGVYVLPGPILGDLDLSAAPIAYHGAYEQDGAGHAIATGADLNGDGARDLVIGAPNGSYSSAFPGRVFVVYGPLVSGAHSVSEGSAQLTGGAWDALTGSALGAVGDLNGDGFDELMVGSQASDLAWTDAGVIYVLFGGVM